MKRGIAKKRPATGPTQKPTTVVGLKSYLMRHGINILKPCAADAAAGTACWIASNLTPWNNILHIVGMELRESVQGRLYLRTFQKCNLDGLLHRVVCSYMISRLLRIHSCIETVELRYEGELFGRSSRGCSVNIADLIPNAGIECLWLSGHHIYNPEACKIVRAAARGSLHRILIHGVHLSYNDIYTLSVAISTSPRFTYIGLHDNGLRACDSMVLVGALNSNATVTTLQLEWNVVGIRAAHQFAEVLKVNTALQKVSLYRTRIGNKGGMAIAEALKVNSTLQILELGYNGIGQRAAAVFAEALTENTSLVSLDLKGNDIGGAGAAVLANMLRVNNTLKELDLCGNMIGDEGTVALATALCVNETLEALSVYSNEFSYYGANALAQCMATNKSLLRLNAGSRSTYGSTTHLQGFTEALKNNTHLEGLQLSIWCQNALLELSTTLTVNSTIRELSLHTGFGNLDPLFIALVGNRSLETLELHCSLTLPNSRMLRRLLECTRTIQTVIITRRMSTTCLTQLMLGLVKNTSVLKFRTAASQIGPSSVAALSAMVRSNKKLDELVVDRGTMCEAGLCELGSAMAANYSLLTLAMVYPPMSEGAFMINETLRRNWAYLYRAVQFATSGATDKCSAEAFEFHSKGSVLFTELTKTVGLSKAEAERAVRATKQYIRLNYFVITRVVKERLVCAQPSPEKPQVLFHQINPYCFQEITSYLKVADVAD